MHPLITDKVEQVRLLCESRRVCRLDLFESGASDDFDPERSDLDFLVEFHPMSPVEHKEAYFGLLDDLERLFGKKVDLVEPGPIRNPYFRAALDRSRVNLYAAA